MYTNDYQKIVVFCDCFECEFNDHQKDYTCSLHEIYLNNGDCEKQKQINNLQKEKSE